MNYNDYTNLVEMAKSYDYRVRCTAAQYGDPNVLDILIHDDDIDVLIAIAHRGIKKYNRILREHEKSKVRMAVASVGLPEDLTILRDDNDWGVLYEVIGHNRPEDISYICKRVKDSKTNALTNLLKFKCDILNTN